MSSEERPQQGHYSRILVMGVGNLLLSDEGVGVHVAQRMMEMDMPPEVRVVEGGTDGFGLINIILEADRMILIDAVRGGGAPASIYRFDVEDVNPCPDIFKTSVHQISIMEVVNLSGLIGSTPYTTIIGVEPRSLEMGMSLSPEVEAKVPKIIRIIIEEAEKGLGRRLNIPLE